MVNHPNRSKLAKANALFYVFKDGAEIDRVSKERSSYVSEARRTKFDSFEKAQSWVDKHIPTSFPSQEEHGLWQLWDRYVREPGGPESDLCDLEFTDQMNEWLKQTWWVDFDILLEERANVGFSVFEYRRTSIGWAVRTDAGWSLMSDPD